MLKVMYDADLADEDIIMAWAGKTDAAAILGLDGGVTKDMRRAATPFVSWLQVRIFCGWAGGWRLCAIRKNECPQTVNRTPHID